MKAQFPSALSGEIPSLPTLMNFQKDFNGLANPLKAISDKMNSIIKSATDNMTSMNTSINKTYKYNGYFVPVINAYDYNPFSVAGLPAYLDKLSQIIVYHVGRAASRKEEWLDVAMTTAIGLAPVVSEMKTMISSMSSFMNEMNDGLNQIKSMIDDLTKALPAMPKEVPGIWKP
jgi:hypothetical protein